MMAWPTINMGELCTIRSGESNTQDAVVDGEFAFFDRSKTPKRSARYLFDCEALIIPGEGTEFLPRHFVGKFDLHQRAYALFDFSPKLDVRFLYYYLIFQKDYFPRVAVGATVKSLRQRHFDQLPVVIPPLPEQRRIVVILDEAFEGIRIATANAEKNLANARELFERTVVESIFGDADAKGWRTAYVSDLAASAKGSIRTGPFGSQLLHSEFVDDGIAVLGIDNAVANEFRWAKRRYISPEKFKQLSRYLVKPGDVIITIMGTCGRCAIVPDDVPVAINTKHLCCITLDRKQCLPEYLHAYFLYHPTARAHLAAQSKGAIMEGLNMGIIKEMPVCIPPIEVQATIAGQIEDLRMAIGQVNTTYEERLSSYSLLKQSILTRAFSGQLAATKGLAA